MASSLIVLVFETSFFACFSTHELASGERQGSAHQTPHMEGRLNDPQPATRHAQAGARPGAHVPRTVQLQHVAATAKAGEHRPFRPHLSGCPALIYWKYLVGE
jgi:hypothetical protein